MSLRHDGKLAPPCGRQSRDLGGRGFLRLAMLVCAAAVIAPGSAAWADTKAGVDDWSRGDYAGALREWQAGAAHGDADAEFNLGQAYMLGRGVPRDLVHAEALFAKAAAQGHLRANDNYGLLLFQRGEHARAMPYIKGAADRGDPRAQYLYGLALFNGDTMPKDWVRAYALVSLAQQSGLPQAKAALAQMDQFIPLEQRRRAVASESDIAAQADANRTRQVTAEDLSVPAQAGQRPLPPVAPAAMPPPTNDLAPTPAPQPSSIAQRDTPPPPRIAAPRPHTPPPPPVAAPVAKPPHTKPPLVASGEWRIQFGAFGVAGNADSLWNRLKSRPEVSGHTRINARAGAIIKLQAGGYSEDSARAACQTLKAAGLICVLAKD